MRPWQARNIFGCQQKERDAGLTWTLMSSTNFPPLAPLVPLSGRAYSVRSALVLILCQLWYALRLTRTTLDQPTWVLQSRNMKNEHDFLAAISLIHSLIHSLVNFLSNNHHLALAFVLKRLKCLPAYSPAVRGKWYDVWTTVKFAVYLIISLKLARTVW